MSAAAVLKTTHEEDEHDQEHDYGNGERDDEHDQLTPTDRNQLDREHAPEGTDPTVGAAAAFKTHTTRNFASKENQASSRRSSVSTASNLGTVGGASVTDTSMTSRSEWGTRRAKGVRALNNLREKSTIRQESCRPPGMTGVKQRQLKRMDSWSTSSASAGGGCDLEGELVLLDGILHDPKIKTWVETTLGPAKSARP